MNVVERELLSNRLRSIADDMAAALARSSRSVVVRDHLDFSTAVFDRHGALVAQGTCLALQLGAMPHAMRAVLERFGPDLAPGDVVLTNDPFLGGGTHLPDFVTIAPVHVGRNLCGFVAILAHKTDVGGTHPGGLSTASTEIFSEGLRIPPVKLVRAGRKAPAIERFIRANVRLPEKILDDLECQVAALRIGRDQLAAVARDMEPVRLADGMAAILDHSERVAREQIAQLPDGRAEFTDRIDDVIGDGSALELPVSIEIDGSDVIVDMTAMPAQVPAAINATRANSYSIALFAMRSLVPGEVAVNDGFARALTVRTTPGTIVDAQAPAPVGSRGIVLYRLWDALSGALGRLLPERAMAAGDGGYDILTFSGRRADGSDFILAELLCAGWGGRADRDGIDGAAHPVVNMSNTPVEVLEAEYPLLVTEYGYVPDSFGDGQFRGGCAVRRGFRVREGEVKVAVRGGRRARGPWGVHGGRDGTPSSTEVQRADGPRETLGAAGEVALHAGDTLVHTVCGAGGCGDPARRDPALIQQEIRDGYRRAPVDAGQER